MPHIGRALLLALLIASTQLRADGISNSGGIKNNSAVFGGIGDFNGNAAPVGGCSGTIDLSTGCVAPMLGGL